ncbi:MAG: hypothetical protein ABIO02_01445 [Patescibacteria group bacterium]
MFAPIHSLLQYIKPFTSVARKVVLVFVVLTTVLSLFSYFAHSDTPKAPPRNILLENRVKLYKIINDKELNKTKEGKEYIALVRSMMCRAIGEGCTNNPSDGDKNIRNSLAGSVGNIVAAPFGAPPASGVQTVHDTLQHAGFVPQANAAMGIGYAAISPYKAIWTIFRNLVFLLLVIIIVAIGFMVMFRTKINAQTVVSLENSLPKIALTLIFITFSFAIAGFMIDIMYVSMFFIAGLFVRPDLPKENVLHSSNHILSQALWGRYGGSFGYIFDAESVRQVATGFYQFIPGAVRGLLDQIIGGYGYNFVLKIAQFFVDPIPTSSVIIGPNAPISKAQDIFRGKFGNMGDLLKPLGQFLPFVKDTSSTGQPIASWITAMLVLIAQQVVTTLLAPIIVTFFISIVLMASLLLVFFRLIFMLIKEYIQILIQIMFAPIFILFEIIPGQSGFMNWVKNLFIHLLTFPLLLMILLVSKTLVIPASDTAPAVLWQPPFIWGFDADSFRYIVGGAFLFMAPEFITMFKEMTGIKTQDMKLNPGAFFASAALTAKAFNTPGKFHTVSQMAEGIGGKKAEHALEDLRARPLIGPVIRNITSLPTKH